MKRARVAWAAGAVAIVAAAAVAWYYPTYRVEGIVRQALRDPDSARFQGVQVFYRTGAACGYVNARNAMGGYVGFTHFTMTPDGSVEFDPKADTQDGEPAARLVAVQKNIAYLRKALENCPDGKESAATPP